MTRLLGTPTSLTPAALLLLASTVVAVPGSAGAAPEADRPDRVRLTAPAGDVVRSATVAVSDPARTTTLQTERFSMVGATWRGADPGLEVRTLRADGWSRWRHADPMADGEPVRDGLRASDLLWVDASSAVQVRIDGPTPTDLDLVLINPGRLAADARVGADPVRDLGERATRPTRAPQPTLLTRRDWDANNKWRNGRPHYLDRLKQVHVHHTATGNSYTRSEVPGILRGMYRYHTKSLGWFDIGYNFLVDRFGRAWVGRSGGANKLVRGAHTLGFNNSSVGIALIGNLENRKPWPDAVKTLAKLAAWKLDKYGRDATGKVTVRSTGSDKYADDERVRLPVIDGHRDTNDTACPGERLYNKLPEIRRRTQWRINHW